MFETLVVAERIIVLLKTSGLDEEHQQAALQTALAVHVADSKVTELSPA
jgi:hypothetical protein